MIPFHNFKVLENERKMPLYLISAKFRRISYVILNIRAYDEK